MNSNTATKIFFLIVFVTTAISAMTQNNNLFEKNWLVQGADTLPYRILYPLNYDAGIKYPVIFFLHGAGERGNDNEKQLTHGAKFFLQDDVRTKYPAFVIFPQCSITSYWSNVLRLHGVENRRIFYFLEDGEPTKAMALLQQLVTYIIKEYPVKKNQVYVGGLSMGGMGTFELVRRSPSVFSAAFSICGGAHPATTEKMKDVKWWLFHGLKDDVVNPEFSKQLAQSLRQKGAQAKLTLYPEANHNSWDAAFAEKDLLPWLFSQTKNQASKNENDL